MRAGDTLERRGPRVAKNAPAHGMRLDGCYLERGERLVLAEHSYQRRNRKHGQNCSIHTLFSSARGEAIRGQFADGLSTPSITSTSTSAFLGSSFIPHFSSTAA